MSVGWFSDCLRGVEPEVLSSRRITKEKKVGQDNSFASYFSRQKGHSDFVCVHCAIVDSLYGVSFFVQKYLAIYFLALRKAFIVQKLFLWSPVLLLRDLTLIMQVRDKICVTWVRGSVHWWGFRFILGFWYLP